MMHFRGCDSTLVFNLQAPLVVLTVLVSFFSCHVCPPVDTICNPAIVFFLETYIDPAGRSYVHRHMVCVSIPIITSNPVLGHELKDMIIASVRTAIQHGVFKLLA
jgi:hypothetical protein